MLVFSRVSEAHDSTLNALMDNFTGIVRLGGDQNGLRLSFDYWQSPEGTVAARNYQLLTLDSELYEATVKVSSQETTSGEINDGYAEGTPESEPHYFYMDPDLGSMAKQMPGVWKQVDTLVGMMHATRSQRMATIILCYQNDTNLRQMAEAAHTLRLSLGRNAKIIAQEKGASLRYQNEALLLRLGVNLVVHRDVPSSRLPLLLESLKGQSFSRDVDINFEAALASVTPTRLRGYLTPIRFVREAEVLLDRASTLSIPFALIVGRPADSRTMTEMLSLIKLSRPGDLITADATYCYLFLNACQQSVMLATMERLVGTSIDAAFEEIRFLVQREEVQLALAALTRAAEHGEAPDYSSSIATQPEIPAPEASPPVQSAAPIRTTQHTSTIAEPQSTFLGATIASLPTQNPTVAKFVTPEKTNVAANQNIVNTFSPPSVNKKPEESVFGKKDAPRATRSAPQKTME
jgi:cellulose biosynthesis protein BcsE